jgi:DHA1 family multidrug resistance protein-like MFS transporter
MWELLWLSGFILLPLFFFLPETSTPTLLYHKARRLRANDHLEATTADTHATTKRSTRVDIVKLALIKPFEITLKDPAIAFVNIYVRLHPSNSPIIRPF